MKQDKNEQNYKKPHAGRRQQTKWEKYAFGKSARFLSAYNLLCGTESQRSRKDGAIRGR